MPTETVCPACGAPVQADTAFCGECDSLVSSAADQRPAAGAPMPPPPPAAKPARVHPVVPSEVLSCWSCDANNPPGRMFCVECGSFIAIGTKVFSGGSSTRSVAAAMAGPASAVAGTGMTGASGTMPLGSYAVAMAAYERTSRRRLLLAAVSLVLVAVVGLSAIYAAITRSDVGGTPAPAAALIVAPTTSPSDESGPVEEAAVAPETQAIEEVAADPERATDEPVPETPEAAVPSAVAPETQAIEETAAGLELDEDRPPEEPATDEVGRTLDVAAQSPDAAAALGPQAPNEPTTPGGAGAANGPVWRNGWVCDGELSLKDERLRDWAITQVSFLPGKGFERVALQLQRVGNGSGGAATLTAEAFPTARVKQEVSAVRQPSAGRTTVAIEFRGGVRSHIGLRRYQPSGLSSIKEFNAYPVGQTSSRVLVSSSTNGCFKVRAPAFGASPNAQRGQLLIDIKS